MPGAVPAAGPFDPWLAEWSAWRPEEVQRLLAGVEAPWYVAGGWAIDLFLGAQSRQHEDLEIAIAADRFEQLASALSRFELFVIGPDLASPLPEAGAESGPALATPLAQAGELLALYHETWVLERAPGVWRLDVFREPSDGDTWICHRDERIRLRYDRLIERTSDGIPYARPEVVLFFKAKAARPKDEEDLATVLPLLDRERRRWLVNALELVHPGHRWVEAVAAVEGG